MKLAKTHFNDPAHPEAERSHFIARVGAWHGATLGALTLGDFKIRKEPFRSLIAQTSSRVSACSTYRGLQPGEDDDAYVRRLAQELDAEFQHIGPGKVCAFVAETVGGSVSPAPPRPSNVQVTNNPLRQAVAPCPSLATSPP